MHVGARWAPKVAAARTVKGQCLESGLIVYLSSHLCLGERTSLYKRGIHPGVLITFPVVSRLRCQVRRPPLVCCVVSAS